MRLVTAAQMRALDEDTITRIGVPGAVLMESAGRGVVERILALHRDGEVDLHQARVVVLAGPGNNGGDGLVVARYLQARGARPLVLICAESERLRGDALLQWRLAAAVGVAMQVCPGEDGAAAVEAALAALRPGDLIVDALFGTGLSRALTGAPRRVVLAANRSAAHRVAVDLPSGMDADLGEPPSADEPAIVRADDTVTFAYAKLGLVGAPGFAYAGRVTVVDIGIPDELTVGHNVRAELLGPGCLAPVYAARDPMGHKGSHGHLLIVAGSRGKTGAALLCAEGAQRAGVGLCTVAAPGEAQEALQGRVLELMTARYGEAGADGLPAELRALAGGKRALAIGPGLPTGLPGLGAALWALLGEGESPVVLDADGLNLLAPEVGRLLSVRRSLVLTPHPGEAARLLAVSTAEIGADRVGSARSLAARTGAVVLLKGARTVIAAPGADATLAICPTGNAGMGTGGMGDLLTGIIGALLARGVPAYEAACAGAYWHGLAGDLLARRAPPGTLLLASEVAGCLHAALAQAQAAPPAGPGLLRSCP